MDDVIFDDFFDDFDDEESIKSMNDAYCKALAHYIVKSNNICVVTGAGISVSAGIPDFRSKEGVWKKYDPSVYGTYSGFTSHPENFWRMSMELSASMKGKQPTKTHEFLTKLQKIGKLQHIITQNVDGLHQLSGSVNVHEVHGTTKRCKCIDCDYSIDIEELLKQNEKPYENIPKCPECGSLLKLDVVLFGEELNSKIYEEVNEIVSKCDLLIVIGCSMEVHPVNLFPHKAQINHAAVGIVNLTPTRCDNNCDFVIRGKSDEYIPKIYEYVEQYRNIIAGLNLTVPLEYMRKAFGFIQSIALSVMEVGKKQLQSVYNEICNFCQLSTENQIKVE